MNRAIRYNSKSEEHAEQIIIKTIIIVKPMHISRFTQKLKSVIITIPISIFRYFNYYYCYHY